MKTLTLVRHAKSDWKDSSLDDIDRPLSKRGERDAPSMAQRLTGLLPVPDRVLVSPALRARQTYEHLSTGWLAPTVVSKKVKWLYPGAPSVFLEALGKGPRKVAHWCWIGHNPGFEMLAVRFRAPIERLPTLAVLSMQWDCADWPEVLTTPVRAVSLHTPKQQLDFEIGKIR